ncbi:hypothetical protein BKA64DRAFT_713751 [Cadophora sp. MPI-SDFR-AT-0126]|nr:hypothetical protein BKA64DRAFT_713751 [Leotiomycetes sp. MPI-SDFR-AT-0126]
MKLIYFVSTLLVLFNHIYAQLTTLSTSTGYSISYETPPVIGHTITLKNVYTITLPDGQLTTSTATPPTEIPPLPTTALEETSRTAGGVYAEATTITKIIEGCAVNDNVDCKTTITSTNMITMTTTIAAVTGTSTTTSCRPGGAGVAGCQTSTVTFTTSTTKLIPVNTVTEITDATTVKTEIASASSSAPSSSKEPTSSSSTAEASPTPEPVPTSSSTSVATTQIPSSSTSVSETTPSRSSTAQSTKTPPTSSSSQIPTPTPSPPTQVPTASAAPMPVTDLCGKKYDVAGALPTGFTFSQELTFIAGGTMYSLPSGRHVVGTATGLGTEPTAIPSPSKLKRSRFWVL